MSRRRTVDASTLLDLTWSTNHFPLPPPDGASPLRPPRPSAPALLTTTTTAAASTTTTTTTTTLPTVAEQQTPPWNSLLTHSTPQEQQCLETPPRRRGLVVSMTTDDDDDEEEEDAPMSPRGAPDGSVEVVETNEEIAAVASGRPSVGRSTSRPDSLGGGRTETEDDEDSDDDDDDDDDDDQSDISDIEVGEREEDPSSAVTGLPKTFNLSLSYEDRFEAYVYDILGNATVDQVHRLFKGYMEENILPNGWLGIWRSGGVFGSAPAGESTASVLVEIENVFIVADEEKLEALATVSLPDKKNDVEGAVDNGRGCQAVVVNHPGSPNSSIFNRSWSNDRENDAPTVEMLTSSAVETVLDSREWNVPLLDVHPVFQRHGGAKLTATALENVRFFYKHIWRPWDSDIAKDEPYASQCLQSRMALHYDMEEGKVNPEDQEKYEKTVSQYEDVRTQLKALHNSMDVSDSENELDEADVAQCAALYEREMALETAIQALENPLLRFLQHDTNFSKMKRQLAQRMRGETCESVTHVVAKIFRARMASSLDPDTVVEHHPTLTSAMENFCRGDIIHIHEGVYSGVSLRSAANGTTIKGQYPISASPSPRRRPVQVSESLDADLPDGRTIDEKNCDERPKGGGGGGDGGGDGSGGGVDGSSGGIDRSSDERKVEGEEERSRSTVAAPIELQVAFNSNVFVDVDPDSDPVVLRNLTLRHLPSPGGGGGGGDGARSQESSPSSRIVGKPNGSFNDGGGNNEELICVKRGCLVLDRVTLLVSNGVGISLREGAALKMTDCVIKGAGAAAVVAHPNSTLEKSGVEFVDCAAEVARSSRLGHLTAVEAALSAAVEADG